MRALYMWGEKYKVLSEIDIYFKKIFFRTEYNSQNINELIKYINKNKINYVCIQNPYLNEKRLFVYKELLKNNNRTIKIKLLISDRGALPNSWFFDVNGFNAESISYNSKYWDHELSEFKEKKTIEYIRKTISTDTSLEKQGKKISAARLRNKLSIGKNKKVLFVPLQRPNDTVIKYFSKNVKNMDDFLQKILEVKYALNDDWIILVKKHPLEDQHLYEDQLKYVDDDAHFKDLLELCDAVALINSGVGVTAMMYQKPVYHFGNTFYSHYSLNKEVKNSQELVQCLRGGLLKVDFEKTKRFISYLINDFYSFGELVTEIATLPDGSKTPAVRDIYFNQIKGLPNKSKHKTLIITHCRFWDASIGGAIYRLQKMILFLRDKIDLEILFFDKYKDGDLRKIKQLRLEHLTTNIYDIDATWEEIYKTEDTSSPGLSQYYNKEFKAKFNVFLKNNKFRNIFVEYINLDYLVNDLHQQYSTFIDTVDIVSARTYSYKKFSNSNEGLSIKIDSLEDELEILSPYSYIIAIQKNEFEKIKENLSNSNKVLLAGFPPKIQKIYSNNDKVININYISGNSGIEHIIWFIEKIWGYFSNSKYRGLTLNIFGAVCEHRYLGKYSNLKNIILHGRVDDVTQAYKNADICVNPVRYGSGLKIKNVEALGFGIPLITTDEGANGIEDGINNAFLLANTVDEWLEAILYMKNSKSLREELSKNSVKYANYYFTTEKCFSKISEILQR